eukprot:2507448-Rhodomonas_salina.1
MCSDGWRGIDESTPERSKSVQQLQDVFCGQVVTHTSRSPAVSCRESMLFIHFSRPLQTSEANQIPCPPTTTVFGKNEDKDRPQSRRSDHTPFLTFGLILVFASCCRLNLSLQEVAARIWPGTECVQDCNIKRCHIPQMSHNGTCGCSHPLIQITVQNLEVGEYFVLNGLDAHLTVNLDVIMLCGNR